MNILRLNSTDFEEFSFDMQGVKDFFDKRGDIFESTSNKLQTEIGAFNFKTKRKGNIYISYFNSFFQQNILSKANTGIDNISFHFIKKGNAAYHLDKKTNKKILIPSLSHNIVFTNEDYKESSLYLKDKEQEITSLHLPISYFRRLVHLYPELFEASFLRYEKGESFYFSENYQQTNSEQYTILNQIENSHLMGTCSSVYVDAKILELLSLIFTQPIEKEMVFKDYDKIKEAALLLVSDIHKPPTIKELSLKVGINEKKLKQGFKAVFKTTVYGYLFEYKMQLAEQLLQNTQKNIIKIALQCGYEYPSHFSTAFKRKFGVSPKELRKKRGCPLNS